MYIGIDPPPPTPTMLVQAEGVEGDPKAEIDIWAERQSDSAESPLPPPSEVWGGGEQMSNQRRKECGAYVTEQREPERRAGAARAQSLFGANIWARQSHARSTHGYQQRRI